MPFLPLADMKVVDVTTSIAGPVLRRDPGGARRRGRQGRAAGHGRRRPRLGTSVLERRERDVPVGERGEALARRLARGRARAERSCSGSSTAPTSSSRASTRARRSSRARRGRPLRARNPRLVYCSIGAYGSVGPLAHEPGYDALMQAAGGLISMTGEPGRSGVRVGSSLIDMGTGIWAALGIVAALLERERTGAGTVVDTSLYETALGYIGYHLVGYLADGTVPTGQGTCSRWSRPIRSSPRATASSWSRRERSALRAPLRCRSTCPSSSRTSASGPIRTACGIARSSLRSSRRACASVRPREWHELLTAAGVPAAPVADVADVAVAEQTEALGLLQRSRTRRSRTSAPSGPALVRRRARDAPLATSAGGRAHRRDPREVGYSDDEIAALAADGVIRTR